jgi:hypothetical protein
MIGEPHQGPPGEPSGSGPVPVSGPAPTQGRWRPLAPLVRLTEGEPADGNPVPERLPCIRNGRTPEPGRPGDPNTGTAGTYFYTCPPVPPLYGASSAPGPLVIDPVIHPDYPVAPGARRAFVDGPEYDIATETLLIPYARVPRWHEPAHTGRLRGEDVRPGAFDPQTFTVLGGPAPALATGRPDRIGALGANIVPGPKKPTLVRLLNASDCPVTIRFTDPAAGQLPIAQLIARDGRPFRDTSDPAGPAPPTCQSGPLLTGIVRCGPGQRFDLLLQPAAPGPYRLRTCLLHPASGRILSVRHITVTAA